LPLLILVAALVLFCVVFNTIFDGKFIVKENLNAIFTNAIIASFTAWGFCFLFALNYIDLSVGAVMAIAIFTAGELGNAIGPAGVVIGGLGIGIALMVVNFNIFAWTKVPSWVAGLGMCLIYEAITGYYVRYKTSIGSFAVMLEEKNAFFGRAPGVYIVFAIGLVLVILLYNHSTLGLRARAIGSRPNIAKTMGISIPKTLILTGIVCGIFIGCAGFIKESYSLRIGNMTNLTSLSLVFPPLATMFLAQVLNRWINLVIAVPFCAFLIYACYNMLAIIGVPSGTLQETTLGIFVIVFGVISQRGEKGIVK
jgi:ribose/xylose/arabinose/galactoside ABC-type transport system permease subunit